MAESINPEMCVIPLVAAIFGLVIIGVVALIIIDLSSYFGMLSSEDPVPQTYQAPSEANITLRSDIVFLSASEMAKKIREGALTSVEVVEGHLSQIYAFNPQVNAVVTVDAEGALERANKADQAFQKGKLWGLSMEFPSRSRIIFRPNPSEPPVDLAH